MFANRKSLLSVFGLIVILLIGLLFVGAVQFDFPNFVLAQGDDGCEDEDEMGDEDDEEDEDEDEDEDCEDEESEDDETKDNDDEALDSPTIDPASFVEGVNNLYFPLVPGTTFVYEGQTEDGLERIEVKVLAETRVVMGVTCMVVQDTVWLEGEIIEDTVDWYAQDKDGNVWYMGEDTAEYENGVVINHNGAWEAGVDGALPGIVMQATPEIGEPYRQEYYEGEAEDMAEVISLTGSATVVYGSFEDLLIIKEWNPLEPGVTENKYYAAGVGLVLEEKVQGGDERVALVEIIALLGNAQ